jgi:HEXXH motif-containing protein
MRTPPPAFLTLPPAGDDTQARLAAKLRQLAFRRLLSEPAAMPIRASLVELARREETAALEAVGAVDVQTPLLVAVQSEEDCSGIVRDAIPTLLVELAGHFARAVEWRHPIRRIVDFEKRRVCVFDPPANRIVAGPSGVEVEGGSERELHPYHALAPGPAHLHLSELDTNPLALVEAHPEKHGNASSLGGREAAEWVQRLGRALDVIRGTLPEWFAELGCSLARIVPVGWNAEAHLSASYREAPGLAYLSLHPNTLTMAEAIVHETQHSKLNRMLYFDPILSNGDSVWAKSEVRPDLRPLRGVLLAVHAFVPVAAMHCALAEADHELSRDPSFARRLSEVRETNDRGLETLESLGEPTEVGRRVLQGLRDVHEFTLA